MSIPVIVSLADGDGHLDEGLAENDEGKEAHALDEVVLIRR